MPVARVHPRVCGEASAAPSLTASWESCPSPRVRGSRLGDQHQDAGWTCPSPRVRGSPDRGACHGACTRRCPSPRVRGSHGIRWIGDTEQRQMSIPACAGKPSSTCDRLLEHLRRVSIPACAGKPCRRVPDREIVAAVSIPACAGKPEFRTLHLASIQPGVHPRVCGEARESIAARAEARRATGPSPRVRGSPGRRSRTRCSTRLGSIPACAGKPPRWHDHRL